MEPATSKGKQRSAWRWVRDTTAGFLVLVIALALYGAYVYSPAESGRSFTSPYLKAVGSRYVDTDVARFHYVHRGSGPPVVLISPGASSVFAWRYQLTALSRTHSVYVVDLPGQGYTRLHDRDFGWDLAAMSGALEQFLDAIGVSRTALAGNSWSGGWALDFAQRHPSRVAGLALLDSTGLDVRDTWSYEVLKVPVLGELLTNLLGARKSTFRSAALDVVVHRKLITPQLVDEWWAPGTFRDNLRANYRLERGLDWAETQRGLATTRTPTLVLWGAQDKVVPSWQAHRLGSLLPDAQVRVFRQCGHAVMLDCPAPVNGALTAFLARLRW